MNIAQFLFFIKSSFHSSKFYQNCFGLKPLYKAILLLIVIALLSLPSAGFWFSRVYTINIPNYTYDEESEYNEKKFSSNNIILREIISQLPTIILHKGVAELAKAHDQAQVIKHPVTGTPVVVVNINGNADSELLKKSMIVINKREIIFQFFNSRSPIIYKFIDIIPAKKQDHLVIDTATIEKLITEARKNLLITIPVVLYPISCIMGFLVIMFRSLVFSATAVLLPKFAKGLSFSALMQLSMLAAVPTAVVEMVISLLLGEIGVSAGLIHLINSAVAISYFMFAVKSCNSLIDRKSTTP